MAKSNIKIAMTRHFEMNWMRRMGNWPTEAILLKIIREGVRVQKGLDLREMSGAPYRQLAVYWHPDIDVIVTIDTIKRPDWVAISCLSRENMSRKAEGGRLKAEVKNRPKANGRRPKGKGRRDNGRSRTGKPVSGMPVAAQG